MTAQGGKDTVLDLLAAEPERLEAGLVLLDRRLTLEAGAEIDVLLRDALGGPILLLASGGDVAADLGRLVSLVAALARTRPLLERFYRERGLDLALRPRAVLVAGRFPDDLALKLELLGALEVQAYEARALADVQGRALLDLRLIHRTRGTGGAAPAGTVAKLPHTPTQASGAAPDLARSLYLRAREAIRSLAPEITENTEQGAVHFRVDGRLLAALTLDQHGFRLRLGNEGSLPVDVADEGVFNECLNGVFDLYFQALGPELPGA